MLNPLPLAVACEMVTLVPPVLVIVSVALCCEPTFTLPKDLLAGLLVNCPGLMPVPESGIVSVGFEAFEVTVTVPLAAPDACGVKVIVSVVLWPGPSATGVLIPLRLKPVPLTEACEMVTLLPPVFVKVTEAFC
jgi:hypothetical protein